MEARFDMGWRVFAALLFGVIPGCSAPENPPGAPVSVLPVVREDSHPARGKVSDRFPNIVLSTQFGDEVRFFDDLIRDRIVLVNFMYTTCTGI